MRRVLGAAGAIALAFLLQTFAVMFAPVEWIAPDFVLATSVAFGLSRGSGHALAVGSAAGLLQDAFSGGVLGSHGFSKSLVSFVAARVRVFLYWVTVVELLLILAGAVVLDIVILSALHWISDTPGITGSGLLAVAAGFPITAGYGLLVEGVLSRKREP